MQGLKVPTFLVLFVISVTALPTCRLKRVL
jgi:hypothetical protein